MNIKGLSTRVSTLVTDLEEMIERKEEAISNAEDRGENTDKLDEQLAILEAVLQNMQDAESEIDGWEA